MSPVLSPRARLARVLELVTFMGALLQGGGLRAADDFDFFERRIRPLLQEHCYECHSGNAKKLRAGLRLDSGPGILKGGESGRPAVVPGDANASLLLAAVSHTRDDLQMPPPERPRLTAGQIGDLTVWIRAGAPYPKPLGGAVADKPASNRVHWAFAPVQRPPLPAVVDAGWPITPVDRFILARLTQAGLSPAPAADRRTLIRRATFDLTGLPPTAEAVNEFVRNSSPEAYAQLIEKLLASPQYGERWGRHWLDVARYSDTKGYVYDREEKRFVHSHVYRDWVVRALNSDMPYDQFLVLQLAADQFVEPNAAARALLPSWASRVDRESLAAMGFLTLGRRFLGVVHDIIDDRIDVVSRGLLGLTAACARCHDHKFDPIPARDYYALYGIFANSTEQTVSLDDQAKPRPGDGEYVKGLKERHEKLAQTFLKKKNELDARLRAKAGEYLVALLDVDKLPSEEFYAIMGPNDVNPVVVRQWEAYLFKAREHFDPVFAPWQMLAALGPEDFAGRATEVIGRLGRAAHSNQVNRAVLAALREEPLHNMKEVALRYGKLFSDTEKKWQATLKAARDAKADPPAGLDGEEEAIRRVLYGPDSPAKVPAGAVVDLEWFFDEGARVELAKVQADIDRWILKAGDALPHAVILADRPTVRNARIFVRGNPANKGPEVDRQFFEVLSGSERKPFMSGSGRLELALAIANRNNPLTARVLVNRVWAQHFGVGIVGTPSDFGTRAEAPSHPELLDWLATDFMDNGWSLKRLHRQMMLSRTYQMSSERQDDAGLARNTVQTGRPDASAGLNPAAHPDPENRLLSRMNRRKMDFETMRDSLLAASGELDEAMGGKAMELFNAKPSVRRTIYGYIDRQFLPGPLRMFDYANPDMHTPQRPETMVPQQALFFMNSPFLVQRARALASRAEVKTSSAAEARIEALYQIAYQRKPSASEVAAAIAFLAQGEAEPEPPAPAVVTAWQYGFGHYKEASQRIEGFELLPHFTGSEWQGGPAWPDSKLGWVQITAEGGHAGNDLHHAAIRRWTAPRASVVRVKGAVEHSDVAGDGIRAQVVSSRGGLLGSWNVHNKKAAVELGPIQVESGETIDFVVDYAGNLNSDMFKWAPVLETAVTSGDSERWDAKKEFGGPVEPASPLNSWERYAQVLLEANEFVFID